MRFDLPFTESSLSLAPRFADHSPVVQVLLLALCFAPVVLVGWLYRAELRLVRRATARGLLALRLVAVLLLIVLVAFQPVVGRTASETAPGRVLVALDRSESMGVTDPQRPAADKLRLARALHLARDLCSDADLEAWIQQADKSGQVRWPLSRTDDPQRARFDRVCQRVDGLTRSQIARAVLAAGGAGLLAAIDRANRVDLIGFAAAASSLDPARLDALPPAGNGATSTDLRVPLARGAEGGPGGKAAAVVVLTDGQHNEPVSPVENAAELGRQGVPVYAVAIGAKVPPTDIVVTTVQAPTTVFKGSDASVEARIEVRGLSARKVEVELQRKDHPPLLQTIDHDGTDRGYTVRFDTRLDEVGTQVLTVHARPAPEETRTENNSRPVAINVADDKARVLLIDGEARWEYYYLAAALARDPGIELTTVLFDQPRIGRLGRVQLRAAGHPESALPAGNDALERFDCIILGDVTPEQLPADDQRRLEAYVGERGGAMIALAGRRAMPLAYLSAAGADPPLRKLLPIDAGQAVEAPDGFAVTLTSEGKDAAFLRMDTTAADSEQRWAMLPKQYWGIIGAVKPAATVLAAFRPDARAAINDVAGWDRTHALIARQNYGFGRVLYVGLDGTWRWRFRAGDTYHHRFWGQVVRWAASDAPLLAGNEIARFGPRAAVVPQGQDVAIAVRFGEKAKQLPPGATAAVRLLRVRDGQPDEPAGQVELRAAQARSRELDAKLRDLPPGRYAVELAIPEMIDQLRAADSQPLRAGFTVSPRPTTEMTDLALNLPLLNEIAAKSGGRVFTAETAAELVDLLARTTAIQDLHTETKLWQAWPTLAIFLGLLTLEWLARKWAGLP